MKRKGSSYRIHDFGPLTVACLGDWTCDGSHRWPKVAVIVRDRWLAGPSCSGGKATKYRRVSIPLPYIRWSTGYRHPVLRPAQRGFDKLYRRAFVTSRA